MKSVGRVALIAATIAGFSVMASAQMSGSCYRQGNNLIEGGLGLGLYSGAYGSLAFPPVAVVYEYGASDVISFGGGIGFQGSSYDDGYGDKWSYSYVPIMARIAFHPLNIPGLYAPVRSNLDLYGGLSFGYYIVNSSVTYAYNIPGNNYYSAGGSYPGFGLLLGARWYFTPQYAVFLEEGSGFGWFTIGLSMKF